jgi:hypothetical protein
MGFGLTSLRGFFLSLLARDLSESILALEQGNQARFRIATDAIQISAGSKTSVARDTSSVQTPTELSLSPRSQPRLSHSLRFASLFHLHG